MKMTLRYGRAGQDLRGAVLEEMGRSRAERRVLLVPERFSHEVERELCRTLGNAGARGCEVLSFSRLASRLTDLEGGGAAPVLDGGGRMLLLYRAMRLAEGLGERSVMRKPAFLNDMLTSVEECRQCRVSPEQLRQAAAELDGVQGQKLREIAEVYGLYSALAQRSAADPATRLDRLAEQLKTSRWCEGKEIWVWGFSRFSAQETEILRILAGKAPVTVAMSLDGAGSDPLFAGTERFVRDVERAGIRVERQAVDRPRRVRESLTHLEKNLFAPRILPYDGVGDVVQVTADDPRGELEWAAAEILRLVREEGYRFRDIGLCAREFAPYQGLAESVMSRFGVPVYLSERADVLSKPVLALVTSALAAAGGGYPYEEMFRYLKTGLTGLSEEERDELENYVLTWNIRGSTWNREKPWDMHPGGYGLPFTDHDYRLLERLDGIRRRVIAPLERLRKTEKCSGREHALALYDMMCEIDLRRSIEQRAEALERRGDRKTAAEYAQLWDILLKVLEQCALQLEDLVMDQEEFVRLFSVALGEYDVGTIPVSLDRVTAGDATRMAGKSVKVLFLLGADSRSIPRSGSEPGLFSDGDRAELARREVRLALTREEKLDWEMTVVYETCTLPTDRLYVSYGVTGGSGENRAPSFLLKRLAQMFPEGRRVRAEGDCRLAAPLAAMELVPHRGEAAEALLSIEEYAQRARRILDAAHWRRGRLSAEGVETLYGGTVPMSATRLDSYNSCHFGHFMRFGLDAKPRQKAKFRPSDYGTFIHAVLERVLGEALKEEGGCAALAADHARRRALVDGAVADYRREELGDLEGESARFRESFARMVSSAHAVAESVVGELAVSDFAPAWFELGFGSGKTLPPPEVERGVRLRLTGFVDRVDTWEKDGKCCLRVVDYKTGKKSFDFADVADGRGLQMLLYLFALRKQGGELLGGKEIVPAGVLYIPARNPVISGERNMTDEEIRDARGKELRRRGLVLGDEEVLAAMEHTEGAYRYLPIASGAHRGDYLVSGEQMDRLDDWLTRSLERVADELAAGNVDANPYWHNDGKNACLYCDYAAACHFEEGCGDKARLRRALSAAEFWKRLRENGGKEDEEDGI